MGKFHFSSASDRVALWSSTAPASGGGPFRGEVEGGDCSLSWRLVKRAAQCRVEVLTVVTACSFLATLVALSFLRPLLTWLWTYTFLLCRGASLKKRPCFVLHGYEHCSLEQIRVHTSSCVSYEDRWGGLVCVR